MTIITTKLVNTEAVVRPLPGISVPLATTDRAARVETGHVETGKRKQVAATQPTNGLGYLDLMCLPFYSMVSWEDVAAQAQRKIEAPLGGSQNAEDSTDGHCDRVVVALPKFQHGRKRDR
eukprot:CAMPEP_0114234104 /NCGR_PEP_ID=MMETSP0058-20121206/5537_1 /TAXON_ID=36894 /ORGANISM="Pyramimonas parkeae, CCMP726" /LENGTH=119 /DNA_ID=CAMNT_0001345773 /DNA_START=4048 /DNA_END=4407 /DNA_ORIENTATION=+